MARRVEWQRDGRLLVNTTTGRVLGSICNEYVEPERDGYKEPVFEAFIYDVSNYRRRVVGLFITLEKAQGGVELEALGKYLSKPDAEEEELANLAGRPHSTGVNLSGSLFTFHPPSG